jgi:cytochrome P450
VPAVDLFAPSDPAFVAWPYDAYDELRRGPRVQYDERTDKWLVSRHADVDALLRDRRLGRSYLHVATHAEMGRPDEPPEHAPFWRVIRSGMLDVEPPDHTRLRRLVSRAFTPRTVDRMRETVQDVTDRLVGDALAQGEFDLLATVAEPLPVTVIAEMLGVPEEDRHLLRPWSADICGMYELNPTEETARTAVRACVEFGDYLVALSRERRKRPQDDLITALSQVVDEGDVLTEDELVGTCVLLLNAGHEATVNVTGNGWWALFRNPDQLARLRSDPSLLPTAVEELMRWDTPLQMFERWVPGGSRARRGRRAARRGARPAVRLGQPGPEVFRTQRGSTSAAIPTRTCPSAPACTSAWVRRWRGWSCRRPSAPCCAAAGARAARGAAWKPGYVIRGLESLRVRAGRPPP